MADDMFNAVITSGQSAMKYMILINGGACMAMLAFIGGVFDKNEALAGGMAGALACFGLGVLLAALVSGSTYLSQHAYGQAAMMEGSEHRNHYQRGDRWRVACVSLGVLSYTAFGVGCLIAYIWIK